jgi:hypothetical protein
MFLRMAAFDVRILLRDALFCFALIMVLAPSWQNAKVDTPIGPMFRR